MLSGLPAVTMIFNNPILDIVVYFLKACKVRHGSNEHKRLFVLDFFEKINFYLWLAGVSLGFAAFGINSGRTKSIGFVSNECCLDCEDVKQWFSDSDVCGGKTMAITHFCI